MEHESSVTYTLQDDGIWVHCTCGWKTKLGYSPSVVEINQAWLEHKKKEESGK